MGGGWTRVCICLARVPRGLNGRSTFSVQVSGFLEGDSDPRSLTEPRNAQNEMECVDLSRKTSDCKYGEGA